ncbi:ATP-dependent DNA helicase [Agromyces sp. NPDC057679]|uniref:ATP-dependent DNA helicase n=1 Tax=Agromyces sp. NPDC057679 TaxID=3346207 RepID=UPI003670C1CC
MRAVAVGHTGRAVLRRSLGLRLAQLPIGRRRGQRIPWPTVRHRARTGCPTDSASHLLAARSARCRHLLGMRRSWPRMHGTSAPSGLGSGTQQAPSEPAHVAAVTDSPTGNEELVDAVLAMSVEIGVGNKEARPRPGQLALARDIAKAMEPVLNTDAVGSGRGHVSGLAGVGIGKSFAALSNAGVRAVKWQERTLYSTKSLSLQAQIVDKDAPVVSEAVRRVIGAGFTTAVLKGWGNYACMNRAYELGMALLGEDVSSFAGTDAIAPLIKKLEALPSTGTMSLEGNEFDLAEMKPLAIWALSQGLSDSLSGDKDTFEGALSENSWSTVSVSPEECIGLGECPFAAVCRSDRARNKAAEADVVVTNHSLLAVQAAVGAPVVLGNSVLGQFDHIIVDEAHELPKVVRSQGEAAVSGRELNRVIRMVRAVADERSQKVSNWADDGHMIADLVEQEIHRMFIETSNGEIGRLEPEADPLEETGDAVIAWARVGSRLVKEPLAAAIRAGQMKQVISGKKAQAAIDKLIASVGNVRKDRNGLARWLQAPPPAPVGGRRRMKPWHTVQSAQVEVGGMLKGNLWTQKLVDEESGDELDISPSVACISGTLPMNFINEVGLNARQTVEYELPFAEAYLESMLYIPDAKAASEVEALTLPNMHGGRRKFSTEKHQAWALRQMKQLIDANEGHALVLSATATGAKAYAAELVKHAAGRYNVYTQWDATSPRLVIAKWKADTSAVLVGTQGLMTGVDAPGETCSLVILDRIPRAAGNPVDDARAAVIAARLDGDGKAAEFASRRMVYVSDACELLGQARGRLVRSAGDRGVFAMLDPRLLKNHPFTYEESSRQLMMKTIDVFGLRTTDPQTVVDHLAGRQASRAAA